MTIENKEFEVAGRLYAVGDVHADWAGLAEVIDKANPSSDDGFLIVGDCGLFDLYSVKHCAFMIKTEAKIFMMRGNHDNPDFWQDKYKKLEIENQFWQNGLDVIMLSDGDVVKSADGKNKCFVWGGASSIDMNNRIEAISWWANEVVSIPEAKNLETAKGCNILFTHDAPRVVLDNFAFPGMKASNIPQLFMKTSEEDGERLNMLWGCGKWEKHYFGHWHTSAIMPVNNCMSRCLGISEVKEVF